MDPAVTAAQGSRPATSAAPRAVPQQPGPAVTARHVRIWLILVLATIAIAASGYVVLFGWSVSDAIFMTITTMTTVGFREVRPLTDAGRLWTIGVALSGVAVIFSSVGIVAEYLVVEATSGRREAKRMADAVGKLRNHYILCGYGRVGATVARELVHSGLELVVIDILPESLARARREGFLEVEGDATEEATLRAAGIDRARGLITTIDSDAHNVYVILSARAMKPDLFVVARANTADAETRLIQAGANRVVSPYTMAGHRLAELATRPLVVDFIDAALSHGELAFSMEEVEVTTAGQLADKTVGSLRDEGVFVLAIVTGTKKYEANPHAGRTLKPGETVIVSGSASRLKELREG